MSVEENKKIYVQVVDQLEKIQSQLRICQAAVGNREYLEIYLDLELFLGQINESIQGLIQEIEACNASQN